MITTAASQEKSLICAVNAVYDIYINRRDMAKKQWTGRILDTLIYISMMLSGWNCRNYKKRRCALAWNWNYWVNKHEA